MEEQILAYTAGIIDGEGCIRITRNTDRGPMVRVHVTNTNKALTDMLKDTFGGYVREEKKRYLPRAKIRHVWEVSAKQAEVFLRLVKPYLLLKREQAEVALLLRETVGNRSSVSNQVKQDREELFARMKTLNRKGSSDAVT